MNINQGDRGPPGLPGGLGDEWIEKIEILKVENWINIQ